MKMDGEAHQAPDTSSSEALINANESEEQAAAYDLEHFVSI